MGFREQIHSLIFNTKEESVNLLTTSTRSSLLLKEYTKLKCELLELVTEIAQRDLKYKKKKLLLDIYFNSAIYKITNALNIIKFQRSTSKTTDYILKILPHLSLSSKTYVEEKLTQDYLWNIFIEKFIFLSPIRIKRVTYASSTKNIESYIFSFNISDEIKTKPFIVAAATNTEMQSLFNYFFNLNLKSKKLARSKFHYDKFIDIQSIKWKFIKYKQEPLSNNLYFRLEDYKSERMAKKFMIYKMISVLQSKIHKSSLETNEFDDKILEQMPQMYKITENGVEYHYIPATFVQLFSIKKVSKKIGIFSTIETKVTR